MTWTEVSLFDGNDDHEASSKDPRLKNQVIRVYELMSDGRWRTLSEIAEHIGATNTGTSARLRDLRKERFGGHTIEMRQRESAWYAGLYEYALTQFGDPALVYDPLPEPRSPKKEARDVIEAWMTRSMLPADIVAALKVLLE